MFEKKTRVNLTNEEKRLLLHSLVELKNDLIRQGRYTDCVDELIATSTVEKGKNSGNPRKAGIFVSNSEK